MKLRVLGVIAAAAVLAGCDDPLNPTPQQSLPQQEALDSPEEIAVATNAMYDAFQACDGGFCRNLILFPDLYADNLGFTGTYASDSEVARRDIRSSNTALPGLWGGAYDAVNRANNVLAAVEAVTTLSDGEAAQFEGEARFVRALGYMTLVNLFGGVPIVTEPTWEVTPDVNVARSTAAEVWAFVESDLNAAVGLLPSTVAGGGRDRATDDAARALLARAHLYQREWAEARDLADAVISNTGRFELLDSYADVFRTEQTAEAILELPFTINDPNALGFWFAPRGLGGRRGVAPTTSLRAALADPLDERAALAVAFSGSTSFGNKYEQIGGGDDDVIVLRLAEMYLIRAEAYARLGNLDEAIEDLNTIRNRAGLPDLSTDVDTQTEVLLEVLAERRRELFYEGHRFYDLRRFGDVPEVAAMLADLNLTGHRLLFPIPQREIDANSALEQNPGY